VRLVPPEDLGREFARIDDKRHPAYPGLALILITGASPLKVRRTHYFQDPQYIDCFSPHPDHTFIPALSKSIEGLPRFINALQQSMNPSLMAAAPQRLFGDGTLSIAQWFVRPGTVVVAGQPVIKIDRVAPDLRSVRVYVPSSGKVTKIASSGLASDELLTIKTYEENGNGADPFFELRQACADAVERLKPKPLPAPSQPLRLSPPPQKAAPAPPGFFKGWGAGLIVFVVWLVVMLIWLVLVKNGTLH
jgi:hypothetical protein